MPTFLLELFHALFAGAGTASLDTSLGLGPRP